MDFVDPAPVVVKACPGHPLHVSESNNSFASLSVDCVQIWAGIIRGKRTELSLVQDLGDCVSIREKVTMTA
jgi:hypothetical protein